MSLPELPPFPISRPRRLRRTPALRRLVSEVSLRPSDLVLPMFVREGIDAPNPITSMPGVVQHSQESLVKAAAEAVAAGVGGLMIFGIPSAKDAQGSGADDPRGVLNVALARLHAELGDDTVLMADLCLDEFTATAVCSTRTATSTTTRRSPGTHRWRLRRRRRARICSAPAG